MASTDRWIITCEHGGARVPPQYRELFRGREQLLSSHRGYDPGALQIARALARGLAAPLIASTTTRLLVDLNRSVGHPHLFSKLTKGLEPREKRAILDRHYFPYRERVEAAIAGGVASEGRARHLSVHTFTPVLNGVARATDVGLLYDPDRAGELRLCRIWQRALRAAAPALRVRRNYPYRGISDGLTTHLRARFPERAYSGIELEVSQALACEVRVRSRELRSLLLTTLRAAAGSPEPPLA